MATRKFHLTPVEVADLSDVLESATGDLAYDRLRAILAYSAGVPWPELAARYHCSRSGLQHWCSIYRRVGKEALISRGRHGGRDSHLTQSQLVDLARRLADGLAALPGIEFPMGLPQSNMVFAQLRDTLPYNAKQAAVNLRSHGVKVGVV